jgi:hypothetical protein
MKILESLRTEKAQHIFEATLIIVLLLILPMLGGHMGKYGGGIAMLAASVIGLIAYSTLYGERLRSRWQWTTTIVVGASLGVAFAAALWFIRKHWQ